MKNTNKTIYQRISRPSDVNLGGNAHGGAVMTWIDEAAFICAGTWAKGYCVTVYAGGIRFIRPIKIGHEVKIISQVIYTGKTSIHISCDVYSRELVMPDFVQTTHCVIVFVAIDDDGKPRPVEKWEPKNDYERNLEKYAIKLKELRKDIEKEMKPFMH